MFKSLFEFFCLAVGVFNLLSGNVVTGILLIGIGIYI
jgi:hypothetical protein